MKPISKILCSALFACGLPAVGFSATGQSVYNSVCAACHATGAANAPKLGDKKTWGGRIAEGQSILTAHAYVGLGAMPPKGGKPDLSLEDFSAAVVYIANQSGANWRNPDAKLIQVIRSEITKREAELIAAQKKKK